MEKTMNRLMIALVAVFASIGMVIAGTVTNQVGQVITTTTGSDGVTTTIVVANGAASVTNRTVLPVGFQLSAASVVDPTLYTPRNYGDFLIGITTGKLWVAKGLTTNDWAILN
jgi:hypothetical protein